MCMDDAVEFRFLKYFYAIGKTGNITAACQELHVSQPSVSEQIRNAENALGVRLLTRDKHGVSLTSEGELLWLAAADLLNGRHELVELMDAVRGGSPSVVRLGCSSLVEAHVIDGATNYVRSIFSGCDISSDIDSVERLEEQVIDGQLDGAFITLPRSTEADLMHCLVESEDAVVCMRADDPLASQDEVPAYALNGKLCLFQYPFVHPKAHTRLLAMLTSVGVTPKVYKTSMGREHVHWLVTQGDCYALVRKSRKLTSGLTTRPIHGVRWTIDTAFIAKRTPQHPAIAMLVRDFRKHAALQRTTVPWRKPPQTVCEMRSTSRHKRRAQTQNLSLFGTGS